MKKFSLLIVGILILSSIAAVGFGASADETTTIHIDFSTPVIIEKTIQGEKYIELKVDGANAVLHHKGEPILPIYSKTIELPFGTKIVNVEYKTSDVKTMTLSEKIMPAPQPMIYGMVSNHPEYTMEQKIYSSSELYPSSWVSYYTGGGLNSDDKHTTFLTIRSSPVRYSPAKNTISYIEAIDITVHLNKPDKDILPTVDTYDLVIITPSKLYDNSLQALADHKNSYGMKTTIKTLEDIYSQYSGADQAEKIKYFIKDAIETWGIKYVLLIGGLDSYIYGIPRDNPNIGLKDWNLPVRYTNNRPSGGLNDPGVICDLYYADIYDSEGGFSSWNSNGDDYYAGWGFKWPKDELDMYPDVHVGRLACRNVWEVKIVTNKIINYEKNAYGSSWYDKIILVGGDSFDDSGTDYPEGEVVAERIYNDYMSSFTPIKLYATHKTSDPQHTPTPDNIIREYSDGAGHIFFDGHANPAVWNTHWPGEFDSWVGGFLITDFPKLKNGEMVPVCAVEGCHNSQFNESIIPSFLDKHNDNHMWSHGSPIPECWSWWMARKIGGGSIATIGNTGLGMGAVGETGDLDGDGILEPDILEALGGFWFTSFYETFSEGKEHLGQLWTGAMEKYQKTFPGMADQTDLQICQQLALLGDPSLKLGGYPPSKGLKGGIVNGDAGISVNIGDTVNLNAYAKNGVAPYTFRWDFDEDGNYDDAIGQKVTYSWNKAGVYTIGLKVIDSNNNVDYYSTIIGVDPVVTKPSRPQGTSQVTRDSKYTYKTSIDAASSDAVYYMFSWGDGTETWTETNSATHSWEQQGTYEIKVKAMIVDKSSIIVTDWSEPLSISVAKTRTNDKPLFTLLKRLAERFPLLEKILQLPILNK